MDPGEPDLKANDRKHINKPSSLTRRRDGGSLIKNEKCKVYLWEIFYKNILFGMALFLKKFSVISWQVVWKFLFEQNVCVDKNMQF